jgi:DNA-binding NarL/FixJ family response regulator
LKSSERDACAEDGLRVIIIEDEAMLALCLGEILEEEGCVVVGTAATLAEAHRLATTAAFDVAIVDLHLCGQKADDVAESIIRAGRGVIISTGSDTSAVPAMFRDWPVLRKPYGDAEILSAIKSAAAIRSPLEPNSTN